MHDEEAFLAAIAEQPEDENCRLIYADWLEERGDPRAEYLRVEYKMRVHGGRGKGKLDALRSQLSGDWLRGVHDGQMGPDWAVVLQNVEAGSRAALLQRISEIAGLSAAESEKALRSFPNALKTGLRYWQAHRLRQSFADLAHVTVEFRPTK